MAGIETKVEVQRDTERGLRVVVTAPAEIFRVTYAQDTIELESAGELYPAVILRYPEETTSLLLRIVREMERVGVQPIVAWPESRFGENPVPTLVIFELKPVSFELLKALLPNDTLREIAEDVLREQVTLIVTTEGAVDRKELVAFASLVAEERKYRFLIIGREEEPPRTLWETELLLINTA